MAAGCFVYRTIDDLIAIRDAAAGKKAGAVVGGGLLGLEAANALLSLGLETHVVEFAPRLMPVQLDDGAGTALRRRVEDLGVIVHTGAETKRIVLDDDGRVERMIFADGTELAVDVVVFSAGIRPRDELARGAGPGLGERGGIVVDERCRTSDKDAYAIGECALACGQIWGLVAPGYAMAQVVADDLAGAADVGLLGRGPLHQAEAPRRGRGFVRRCPRPNRRARRKSSSRTSSAACTRSSFSPTTPSASSGGFSWATRPPTACSCR